MTDASPDWAELRRRAEAVRDGSYVAQWDYRAAANPATILAILDRAEKAEAEAKALREALRPFGVAALGIPPEVADSSDGLRFARSTPAAAFRRARALTGGDHG